MIYSDTEPNGVKQWSFGRPRGSDMRVPDNAIESVAFVCIKGIDNGVEHYTIGGTAFFVSIPSETDPDIGYVYLVTARHCIDAAKEAGNLYIRVNLKAGGAALVQGDPYAFETPPDDDPADVAFALAAPPTSHFRYVPVGADILATDELITEKQIGLGDEVVAIGLHASRAGLGRNLPIMRSGIISCMPYDDEPLQDESSGLDYKAYLAELRSVGGLSGSPVFAMLGRGRLSDEELGGRLYKGFLIGLIRGHYHSNVPVLAYDKVELEKLNEGIAIVTPIQEFLRLVNSEASMKPRKAADKARLREKSKAVTQDSAFASDSKPKLFTERSFTDALKKASRKTSEPESRKTETSE